MYRRVIDRLSKGFQLIFNVILFNVKIIGDGYFKINIINRNNRIVGFVQWFLKFTPGCLRGTVSLFQGYHAPPPNKKYNILPVISLGEQRSIETLRLNLPQKRAP